MAQMSDGKFWVTKIRMKILVIPDQYHAFAVIYLTRAISVSLVCFRFITL